MSDSGTLLLSDFYLVNVKKELQISELDLDHIRYMPPDHLIPDKPWTAADDCFSFATISFEVNFSTPFTPLYSLPSHTQKQILSKTQPFVNYVSNVDVVLALHNSEPPFDRPLRRILTPPRLDETLWDLMRQCWATNPKSRPKMSDINGALRAIHSQVRLPRQPRGNNVLTRAHTGEEKAFISTPVTYSSHCQ